MFLAVVSRDLSFVHLSSSYLFSLSFGRSNGRRSKTPLSMDGADRGQRLGRSHEPQTHPRKDQNGTGNHEIVLARRHRSRSRGSRGTAVRGRRHHRQPTSDRACTRGGSPWCALSHYVSTGSLQFGWFAALVGRLICALSGAFLMLCVGFFASLDIPSQNASDIISQQPWYYGTRDFPHPMSGMDYVQGRHGNLQSYSAFELMMWSSFSREINKWRISKLRLPYIYGLAQASTNLVTAAKLPFSAMWSASFVPKPEDWPEQCEVVGTFFVEQKSNFDSKPFEDLTIWLDNGPKPVFIGFGSMYELLS